MRLPNLSKLNLSRTAVANDSLTALETFPSLKRVFLRETAIGRERILALKKIMNFSLQIDSSQAGGAGSNSLPYRRKA
jgi:hypothetical protein